MMNPVLLTYAGPPVIGAFIGYLTNKIAIRMLFRPLKPWYVLGYKVPMTPGIIPSKRHELAENIGVMVGEHLLTAREIGEALSMEPFQEHLHALVENRIHALLMSDLGPVMSVVPKRFRAYVKVGVRTLKYQMRGGVHRYIHSSSFTVLFSNILEEQIQLYGKKDLNSLFSAKDRQQAYGVLNDLLARLLNGPGVEDWLAGYVCEQIHRAAESGKSVREIFPEPFTDFLLKTLTDQTPELLRGLAGLVAEPAVRDKIIQAVLGGIDHFLSAMGPMAAMAKGFIDPESLAEKIREYLTVHEVELECWLQSPEVHKRFVSLMQEQAEKLLQTPVADLLNRIESDRLDHICRSLAVQLLGVLRTPGSLETLSQLLRQSLEDMLNQGDIPLADIARQLFPDDNGTQLRETFSREVLAILHSDPSAKLIGRMVNAMVDALVSHPLGVLARLMPAGVRSGITDYIVLTANRMLLQEVPGLVKSLNISRLVTDKVDSLDLLKLERLLLSIMEEQFKYINLFGAVLGFLIGLINLAILQLG